MNLAGLPHHYTGSDTSRMTLGMFCLSGLDLLDDLPPSVDRNGWIEWIYDQQFQGPLYGFRGGPFMGPFDDDNQYDVPHITMTYAALVCLMILGDNLSRVKKSEIIQSLRILQRKDGSFSPVSYGSEQDMRFLYCACAISFILNDWSGFDLKLASDFIKKSQNFDGGFGTGPNQESHGGTTYCALSAMALMGKLHEFDRELILSWLIGRQTRGFHGRINKDDDTCYAYWVGGSLKILDAAHLIDKEELDQFLKETKTKFGGYGKYQGAYPDVMHSYMGLAGLSIVGLANLSSLFIPIGLTTHTLEIAKSHGYCLGNKPVH